jgi:glycosyltransferase involved in cell wall biosynthesis
MQRTVSVVIPAYNAEPYIRHALRSAILQTYPALEIIVIDDGSSDGTAATAEAMGEQAAEHGHTLHVVRQSNSGPAGARNTGLALAKGTYVGFLDADDTWDPNKITLQALELDRDHDLDVSFSWWRVIEEAGGWTGRVRKPRTARPRFADLCVQNALGPTSTALVRRQAIEAVGGFDPAPLLKGAEDLDLWLRISCLRDGNIACIPRTLVSYRLRRGQITADWRLMEKGWLAVMDKAALLRPHEFAAVRRVAQARVERYWASLAYKAGKFSEARSLVARAWVNAPWALATERSAWLISLATAATFLPGHAHKQLAEGARAFEAKVGRTRLFIHNDDKKPESMSCNQS